MHPSFKHAPTLMMPFSLIVMQAGIEADDISDGNEGETEVNEHGDMAEDDAPDRLEVNEADMNNEATMDGRMHPPYPKLSSEEIASIDRGIQSSMLNMIKSKFDASDEGRGIILTMKPKTAKNYGQMLLLLTFAGQQAGLTTAAGIITDFIAVESQS